MNEEDEDAEDKVITFYDFPSKKDGVEGWNPFPVRIRLALKYKGIPFKTVWVEYPDVELTLKAAGIPPTTQWPDGKPWYTLPAIVDPSTGVALADSFAIAEYLDKTYPDKPLLMPSHTKALQTAFNEAVLAHVRPIFPFVLIKFCGLVHPVSEEYFRRTRIVLFGKSVDEMVPQGENAKEEWKKLEEGFGKIAGWMKKEDEFVMGDTVSFADFVIGGWLILSRLAWGNDSKEWKEIAEWHDGRWGKLVKSLEPYYGK
ncbi:hypothetical protein D9758_014085 [Tetrapyrgos nigripes]|uniref:GST N-terminal domain-containing protein n=1 Tax=Tetrapyrgos nigripes TaxID=182062 RepID=A0A8H5FMA3_9AGAR|nr:hypothetical protein D9758_014085 [Tetrapyrgos nigripes]